MKYAKAYMRQQVLVHQNPAQVGPAAYPFQALQNPAPAADPAPADPVAADPVAADPAPPVNPALDPQMTSQVMLIVWPYGDLSLVL